MKVKGNVEHIEKSLENICKSIENIIEAYESNYAENGWDSFAETLNNVSAQLYMMRVMIHNSGKVNDRYRCE